MHMKNSSIKAVAVVWVLLVSMTVNAAEKIVPVPFTDVKFQDEFWAHRQETNRLVKIGAKVVSHARYVTFQMAEVLVSRSLFYEILERIKRLKPIPVGYD